MKEQFEFDHQFRLKREQELHNNYQNQLNDVKQTEFQTKTQLETNIKRLESDLESERLKFKVELDRAVHEVCSQKDMLNSETLQKQFSLELRVHTLEQVNERLNQTNRKLENELIETKEYLAQNMEKCTQLLKNINSIDLIKEDFKLKNKQLKNRIINLKTDIKQAKDVVSIEKDKYISKIKQLE